MGKDVAILYFGGTSIHLVIASRGVNGSLEIKNRASCSYSGIVNGEFVSPGELPALFTDMISSAFQGLSSKIDKLYIGTPPVFCSCVVKEVAKIFPKPKKIGRDEIASLFDSATRISSAEYQDRSTVINKSAVYYRIDDGHAVIDAAGLTAKKLMAQISMIIVDNNFVRTIKVSANSAIAASTRISSARIKKIEFISEALAESLYLLDDDTRDRTCVLISSGTFATSVAVVCGDGLISLQSFAQGLAHIVDDVSRTLNIDFETARLLTSESVLNIKMGDGDKYDIAKASFPASQVNAIIKERMDSIARELHNFISRVDENLLSSEIYITGGHIDSIAGARNYLSKVLGSQISQAQDPFTQLMSADEPAIRAILNLALLQES